MSHFDVVKEGGSKLRGLVFEARVLKCVQGFLGSMVVLLPKTNVLACVATFADSVKAAGGGCELPADVEELLGVLGFVWVGGVLVGRADVRAFDRNVVSDFGGSFGIVLLGVSCVELEVIGEASFDGRGDPFPVVLEGVALVVGNSCNLRGDEVGEVIV